MRGDAMTGDDIFDNFDWHSVTGFDRVLQGSSSRPVRRLAKTASNMDMFEPAGDGLLIHKTKGALWRLSDDGNAIVPVFDSEVLTAEDLESLEGGG